MSSVEEHTPPVLPDWDANWWGCGISTDGRDSRGRDGRDGSRGR